MSYRDRKQRDHKNPKTHGDGRLTEILRCVSVLSNINDHPPNLTHILCFAALFATFLLLAGAFVAGILIFVTLAGLFSGGIFGLAVSFGVRWLYNYVNGGSSG
ncbi:hypothetical protein SUGI_0694150 [Cryptomeria japonica]|nr:hypothetical protein SUGI_0694150 [Cryptomeria japonica]